MSSFEVEVVSDPGRFRDLKPDWSDLHAAASGAPFSSHDWITVSERHYPSAAPRIVTLWQAGTLVAAAPLAFRKEPASPRLKALKVPSTSMLCRERVGFHEILVRPGLADAIAPTLLQSMNIGTGYIDLTPMRLNDGLAALIAAAPPEWHVQDRSEITTSISDIGEGWEAYAKTRKSSFRKNLRVAGRRVAEAGGVIERTVGADDDSRAILEKTLDLSARTWKSGAGTDIGSNETVRAFFRDLYDAFQPDGMRIYLLSIEGDPAAASTYMIANGVAYGLINDFDDRFASLSPGRAIVAQALEDFAGEGLSAVDMLRSTPFTDGFATRQESFRRVRFFRGFNLARGILHAETALKAARRSIMGQKERVKGRQKALGKKDG